MSSDSMYQLTWMGVFAAFVLFVAIAIDRPWRRFGAQAKLKPSELAAAEAPPEVSDLHRSLGRVLDSYEEPAAPPPEAPPAWSQPASTYVEAQAGPFPAPSPEGREAWFRRVAHDRLLPMLDDIVLQAREHGQSAEYELHTPDGRAQYRIEVQRADHPPGQPLPYMAFACGEENDVALLYGGTVPGPQDHNGADTEIGWREVSWGEVEPALVKFAQRLFRR